MAAEAREGKEGRAMTERVPSPLDPKPRTCANCTHLDDTRVCHYEGCGNTVYPPDYKGRKIHDVTQHCGQHRFRRSA